jgi:hypothetical protein
MPSRLDFGIRTVPPELVLRFDVTPICRPGTGPTVPLPTFTRFQTATTIMPKYGET